MLNELAADYSRDLLAAINKSISLLFAVHLLFESIKFVQHVSAIFWLFCYGFCNKLMIFPQSFVENGS